MRRGRAFEAFELLESPDRPLPSDPDEALEAELAAARVASDLRLMDAALFREQPFGLSLKAEEVRRG